MKNAPAMACRLLSAACLCLSLLTPPVHSAAGTAPATRGPGDYKDSILVDGLKREYMVHVPKTFNPKRLPMPVVLAFHGGGGTAQNMQNMTFMNLTSYVRGFIVVYPQGSGNQWNDGRPIPGYKPVDDVKFVKMMINKLASDYNIDRKRVYATGISNGGFFSEKLAFEASDQIAAFAPVVATMSMNQYSAPLPKKGVPIMFILGTEDTLVPWNGGAAGYIKGYSTGNRGLLIPAGLAVNYWVKVNGCYPTPNVSWFPDTNTTDNSRVKSETYYPRNDSDNEVVLYTVVGGGHTWPGGVQYAGIDLVGYTNRDINANDCIWQFFSRHALK